MSDAHVICAHPSFPRPDGTPVLEAPSSTVGGVRTGPVAPNGAGESTLLTLIAGEYGLRGGTVTVDGTLGRPPQSPPPAGDLAIAEVAGSPTPSARSTPSSRGTPPRSTSRRSATTGTSGNAPAPSRTGSASATSGRPTNPPTTWTSTRAAGRTCPTGA